jgi:hypothetical protein
VYDAENSGNSIKTKNHLKHILVQPIGIQQLFTLGNTPSQSHAAAGVWPKRNGRLVEEDALAVWEIDECKMGRGIGGSELAMAIIGNWRLFWR